MIFEPSFPASWTKVADELLATNLAKRGASTQLVATLCISAEQGYTVEERERETRFLRTATFQCHCTK